MLLLLLCVSRPCVTWLQGVYMCVETRPPPQDWLYLCPGTADQEITLLKLEHWCWEIKVFNLQLRHVNQFRIQIFNIKYFHQVSVVLMSLIRWAASIRLFWRPWSSRASVWLKLGLSAHFLLEPPSSQRPIRSEGITIKPRLSLRTWSECMPEILLMIFTTTKDY